jgi:hypothetical protein
LSAVVGTPSASDQSGGTPTGGSTPGTEVRTQVQVDVWSNWECAGGVALALGVPCSACTEHQEIVEHTATKRLTVEFPAAWEPAGHVVTGNVFRLTEIDGTVSEFRIDDVSEASPLGMKSATANDPLMDLAQAREIISETNANLTDFAVEKTDTASNLLTFVLGFAPSYVTLGTVTSTTRVKVTFDWAMPLAAAQAVATAIKSDEGVTYQISLRRNGASGYLLDLTVLGATATVATFRTAKNLAAFSKRTVGQDYANRVYPQTAWSDQTGVGEHLFLVTAVSTNAYIEIDDPAFRGTNPITEDDALNNLFWVPYNEAAGTATARMITDTVKASKRLHMASTSGIAVGDMGRIARNSGKDFLSYVETPSRQASGIRVVRLTTSDLAFDNVFANPSAQRWTAGQIDYWTSTGTGGWPAEETSVVFTGTRSIRFQNNAANSFYRFRSHNARIWTARSSSLQVKFRVWYKNLKNGDTNAVFFQISTNPSTTQLVTGGVEVADWTAWESSASALTTIRNELWLEVVQTAIAGNTNARAYIGHVEAIVHETGTTLPPGPVLASNTTGAWLRGVTYLANDPATYDVGVMDLTRQDQAQWPYDGLTLGGSVSVVPDDLATVSNRVVGMEKDHLNRMNTRITLAKQADKLSAIVAAS